MPAQSEIRFGRLFGYSDTHPGDGTRLTDMTMEVRTEVLAYFHACPVRKEVVEMYGLVPTFKRYMECNQIHKKELLLRAMDLNFDLYIKMVTPVRRIAGELPDPKIDPNNVPPSFKFEMSPLSAPTGYAPAREVLVWAGIYGGEKDGSGTNSKERVAFIKSKLDELIRAAKDPIQLMLMIGEEAIIYGASSDQIIGHVMSAGILKEQGCKTMYREIFGRMKRNSPEMYSLYKEMNKHVEIMRFNGIIPIQDLK